MRTVLLTAALLAVPSVASAQGAQYNGYIEGHFGMAMISPVETKDFLIDTGVDTIAGKVTHDYGSEMILGVEVGSTVSGLTQQPIRFGLSLDYASIKDDTATFDGTINGVPVTQNLSEAELVALGLQFDNDVHLVQANMTFDLLPPGAFTPFVGIGAGAAIIQNGDVEVVLSANAGARLSITRRVYIGGRYRFSYITETDDDLGFAYEPITFHTFSAILGVRF